MGRAAGDVEFSAAVDQTTVGLGEQFQLSLTVQATTSPRRDAGAARPARLQRARQLIVPVDEHLDRQRADAASGFDHVIYGLQAKRLGKLTIPPAR